MGAFPFNFRAGIILEFKHFPYLASNPDECVDDGISIMAYHNPKTQLGSL